MSNTKPKKRRKHLRWGDEQFTSRAATERAIATHLAGELTDGDLGLVHQGGHYYHIQVIARLVGRTKVQ